jgi:hypothetical protein
MPTTREGTNMSIDREIASMLVTSTGAHFLDSGSAYGREWERNQAEVGDRDPVEVFRSRPEITVDRWGIVTLDVFHWLTRRLDTLDTDADTTDGRLLASYDAAVESEEVNPWSPSDLEDWVERHADPHTVWTCNTYNNECLLGQTLQYVTFTVDSEQYVLLQIHQGADVRGGYTAARLFRSTVEYFGSDVAEYHVTLSVPNKNYGQISLGSDTPESDNDHRVWEVTASVRYPYVEDVSLYPWNAPDGPDVDMEEITSEDAFSDNDYDRVGPDQVVTPMGTLFYSAPYPDC